MEKAADSSDQNKTFDLIKWLVGLSIIGCSIAANSIYNEEPLLYRVLFILAAFIISMLLISTTVKGSSFVQLVKDARIEARKIVWPERQDTLRTTLFVLIVVSISSIILWVLDMALGKLVSGLIG